MGERYVNLLMTLLNMPAILWKTTLRFLTDKFLVYFIDLSLLKSKVVKHYVIFHLYTKKWTVFLINVFKMLMLT